MKCIKKNAALHGQDICKGEKMTELESKKDTQKELELDDLLISGNDNEVKSGGGKKIVLLGAIGVLLFAIVVLVVYLLQGDSKEPQTQDLGLERVESTPANNQSESTDYTQVPIQNEQSSSDDQFQKIIDQIKAQQAQQNAAQELPAAPVPKAAQQQKPESQKQPQIEPKKPQQKQEAPKATAKDTFSTIQTQDPKLQGSEAERGFYIQVGSFSKFSPNKQLLGLIEKEKYSYRMQKAGDNNRLLIGPYTTKAEAQNKLTAIREKINKDAFIKEIK